MNPLRIPVELIAVRLQLQPGAGVRHACTRILPSIPE